MTTQGNPSNSIINLDDLQHANTERNLEWDGENKFDLMFFSTELAGEVGETIESVLSLMNIAIISGRLCNLTKKLQREALDISGSRANPEDVENELADLVICASLLANKLDINLSDCVRRKFNADSAKHGFVTRI